jgi:predicted metalloprotease
MEWEGKETSENVEDERGSTRKTGLIAGGGIGSLVLIAVAYFLGVDPNKVQQIAGNIQQKREPGEVAAIDDKNSQFSKTILGMTEKVWTEQFRVNRYPTYETPKMHLFRDETQTGCGIAQSAVGPFYCPADQKVYLDFAFFEELQDRLGGSSADFSKAYVVAHEVGHHVQNLLGYSEKVDSARGSPREKEMSVRLELQADYLAGCWAFHADKKYHVLETGDVEAALKTAKAIGDDKLQERARGYVNPREFTHGTSAQRYEFFREGLKTGDASKARLDKFFNDPFRNGEIISR